jgi:hypothetical protein
MYKYMEQPCVCWLLLTINFMDTLDLDPSESIIISFIVHPSKSNIFFLFAKWFERIPLHYLNLCHTSYERRRLRSKNKNKTSWTRVGYYYIDSAKQKQYTCTPSNHKRDRRVDSEPGTPPKQATKSISTLPIIYSFEFRVSARRL